MDRIYNIYLDDQLIGTTRLEKADASMGVVFGQIELIDISAPYDFFKSYCQQNKLDFDDYLAEKIITTRTIPTLKIISDKGQEIEGIGNQITGMDSDTFEVSIVGIPYPFYGEEFPHHVRTND